MFLRAVRVAVVVGLVVAFAVPACGGSSSSSGPSAAAGNGGVGGAAAAGSANASAGRAGADGTAGGSSAAPVACGSKTCTAVVLPESGSNFVIPACCSNTDTNICGLDSTPLAAFGPTFSEACQPLGQPGPVDTTCANSPKTAVSVQGITFTISFMGCCRADTGTCGYELDTLGGLYKLGLGCVDSAPFLEGGTPAACGDAAGGSGSGGTGAGGGGVGAGGATAVAGSTGN